VKPFKHNVETFSFHTCTAVILNLYGPWTIFFKEISNGPLCYGDTS